MHTLLRGLSPGYLRIGGTTADALLFDEPYDLYNHTNLNSTAIMTKTDWDNLVNLTSIVRGRLLFDHNLQLRFGQAWDPTNAIKLLQYSASKAYGQNIDFELGNEPGLFGKAHNNVLLSGQQIGQDLLTLKQVASAFPTFRNSNFVGPDVVVNATLFKDFLEVAGKHIRAATIHHYYFAGPGASWKEYVNWKHFNSFTHLIETYQMIIKNSPNPKLPLWVGETSDAYNSGTPNVSDRFVSGFLWLDKLGVGASLGVGVIMRQTFDGGNYALLDLKLNPNPDYWLSYIHKKLVGIKVLSVSLEPGAYTGHGFRIYAHCTNPDYGYPPGAVTVFFLNVEESETLTLKLSYPLDHGQADLYMLTAPNGDPQSPFTQLNDRILHMVDDHTLPHLYPRLIKDMQYGVDIPPYAMGFLVLTTAHQPICFT